MLHEKVKFCTVWILRWVKEWVIRYLSIILHKVIFFEKVSLKVPYIFSISLTKAHNFTGNVATANDCCGKFLNYEEKPSIGFFTAESMLLMSSDKSKDV